MYRALYAYAWDLAEIDLRAFAAALKARHLNTVTLAGSYHAGKFLRPKGRRGRICFPEDGTVYFHARPERYGRLKPQPNSLLADSPNGGRDMLGELCALDGLATNAWMVLLHNSQLGAAHPEATVANAFGDRYPYSLCPANPDVRAYAAALCADVTDAYPVIGVSLETPGYLPFAHGYHHEFALMRQNAWLDMLLGLCFCEHCVAGAKADGIDADGLKAGTAAQIDAYLGSEIDAPDDMAAAWLMGDLAWNDELGGFIRWRCDTVASLVGAIRAAVRADAAVAVIPSVVRPSSSACWAEGSDLPKLVAAAGVIEACFYEAGPARIAADVWDVRRRLGKEGKLRGILRPGWPDLASRDAVIGAVAALHAAGVEDIGFYNYGHLRQASLDWVGDALRPTGTVRGV